MAKVYFCENILQRRNGTFTTVSPVLGAIVPLAKCINEKRR